MMKLKLAAINVILFLLSSSQAQTSSASTGEVSIVAGSTSVLSVSKTEIPNLSSTLFTGITIPTTAQPTSIVFVTGCNTCARSTASPTATVNESVKSDSQLTTAQLGGIIGGCAGALILIIIAIVLICFKRRHRKKEELAAGIGVSSYNIGPPPPVPERKPSIKPSSRYDDGHVKRYNVSSQNTNDNQDNKMVPPVILYSDSLDQQQQDEIGVQRYTLDNGSPQQRRLERNMSQASSNGARLSKYNFLSQAFSQMRNSYAVHANNSTNDEAINMSPVLAAPQKKPHQKYQMYSMYHDDSLSEMNAGGSSHRSHSPTTRESAMTVGTLHAPLFQRNNNNKTPSPLPNRPQQYTSQLNVSPAMRSPVSTDVSEYNSQPPTSPTDSYNSKKTYPYF